MTFVKSAVSTSTLEPQANRTKGGGRASNGIPERNVIAAQ